MPYAFEQLRVHFLEHTVRRVWHEGNAADSVIQAMRSELQQELTADDHLELRNRVNFLCNETEKLLRSRTPHDVAPTNTAIELWGYQHIQPLTPNVYVRHNQPTRLDFDQNFQIPADEVWAWNVVYTMTGPYYGAQAHQDGTPATRYQDLGSVDFVLDCAAAIKTFPGCEVLGDLTPDNIDGFTLEANECQSICATLHSQNDGIKTALTPLIQAHAIWHQPEALIALLAAPLESALHKGIAQFKRGKIL